MKTREPIINGDKVFCPVCQTVELKYMRSEYESIEGHGRVLIMPGYSYCPTCDWHNGDEVTLCDYCGEFVEASDVQKVDGGDYCGRCKRQEEIQNALASIAKVTYAITAQTKFAAFHNYRGHADVLHVTVTTRKSSSDDYVAHQTIHLDEDDAVERLTAVHATLAEIASTGKIPALKRGNWGGYAIPILEQAERQVSVS